MELMTLCGPPFAAWSCALCIAGACGGERAAVAPKAGASSHQVALAVGKPASISSESLTIELVSVKDNRCAVEVKCVWAGSAELTLRLSKAGGDAETLVLATMPPAQGDPPRKNVYGAWRLSLDSLEPPNSMVKRIEPAAYRAMVTVARE